jgi:deoxynucleoside triphosphate triphosphohydrolase SAMHD1
MLVDALVEANDYLGISLHANDPEYFWKVWYQPLFFYWVLFFSLSILRVDRCKKKILHVDLLKFQLDDTIIKGIETAPNNELKKSKEIIQRIRRRELYKVLHLFFSMMLLYLCSFVVICHTLDTIILKRYYSFFWHIL